MYFVVLRRSGPKWQVGVPIEKQSRWPEHAQYMNDLVSSGFVVLGGPLADEQRVLLVIEAESEMAVRDGFAKDPWHKTHLVIESVDQWTIRLDGRKRR